MSDPSFESRSNAQLTSASSDANNDDFVDASDTHAASKAFSRFTDVLGLDTSGLPLRQEQVVYKVTRAALHHPTRVLFVGNLRRPVMATQFQNDLRVMVKKIHPSYKIDRAWMNRSRTHAIVLTNSLEASRAIRRCLNGTLYPSADDKERLEQLPLAKMRRDTNGVAVSTGRTGKQDTGMLTLFVDYMMLSQINEWIFEEDFGPRDAAWRVVYRRYGEYGDVVAEHLLLEGEFRPIYQGVSREFRGPRVDTTEDKSRAEGYSIPQWSPTKYPRSGHPNKRLRSRSPEVRGKNRI